MQTNALTIRRQIAHLICTTKGIKMNLLTANSDFRKLGFDELDLLEVILAVEKKYHIVIPDEVPLNTINDFVQCICSPQLMKLAG
ncbi:MAG TPA: acyl carrier protein [Adhaeribacter sp.]|nr:acyl carrier protein [Adhaeribacter sp.]